MSDHQTSLPRLRTPAAGTVALGVIIAIAASFMGYNLAKRFSKDPESFGKGRIEGVFAPETAAHASGTAALLPMTGVAFLKEVRERWPEVIRIDRKSVV